MKEPIRFQSPEYIAVLSPEASKMQCSYKEVHLESMRAISKRAYPEEACGLLIGRLDTSGWEVLDIREVDNINTERADDRFQLDPRAYNRIDQEIRGSGKEIIGVFHSHPDCPAKPSPTDLENAWEGFIYPIVSVIQGEAENVLWWTLEPDQRFHSVKPLQERS